MLEVFFGVCVCVSHVAISLCLMQGFGEPSGEHWLGNEIIHKLTSSQEYSLHVQLKDREGNEAFSHYDRFYIDGEENNYRWKHNAASGRFYSSKQHFL